MAYSKKDWVDGETIEEAAMDNIENGVSANDTKKYTAGRKNQRDRGKTR